ncbi:MAG TPA: hypothetical protein VGN97_04940 [Mesorhizobium sp.]|nr:hypothetical protein [Mesorhizobium sp.]
MRHDPPQEGRADVETAEFGRQFVHGLGERREQREPRHPVRMIQRELERDRPAQAVADHQRPFQSEHAHQSGDLPRLLRQAARRAIRPRRIARAGSVEGDQPEAGQAIEQGMGEVEEMCPKAMDEEDRRPFTLLHHMKTVAARVHEAAGRRHGLFGHLRDAPRFAGEHRCGEAADEPGAGGELGKRRESGHEPPAGNRSRDPPSWGARRSRQAPIRVRAGLSRAAWP